MNKKKLCATLTLSAFAASLLPGMAFATGSNTDWGALGAGDTSANPPLNITLGEGVFANPDWLSEGDKVTVERDGYSETENFSAEINSAKVRIVRTADNGRWAAGTYTFTITNADGATTEEKAKTVTFTRTLSERAVLTFGTPTAAGDGSITLSADSERVVDGGFGSGTTYNQLQLYALGTDKNARRSETPIKATFADNSGSYTVTVDEALLTAGEYYGVAGPNGNVAQALQYTNEMAKQVAEMKAGSEKVVDDVIKALPKELKVAVTSNDNDVNFVTKLNVSSSSFTDASGTVKIKSATGDFANCQISELKDKMMLPSGTWTSAAGDITFEFSAQGVTKTQVIPVTVERVTGDLDEIMEQYVVDNKLQKAADGTYTVTLAKGDKLQIGKFSYIAVGSLTEGNIKLILTKNPELNKYIVNGEVTEAPAADVTGEYEISFAAGKAITVAVTIKAGSTDEFDPTKEFTKDELEALDEAQLAEVKEVADQAKADAKVARDAKAEEAAKAFVAEELDLDVEEDFDRAMELYMSYKAERDAYKEAKAYVALVESVSK